MKFCLVTRFSPPEIDPEEPFIEQKQPHDPTASDIPVELVEPSSNASLDAGKSLDSDFARSAQNVHRNPISELGPATLIFADSAREYLPEEHHDRIIKRNAANPPTRPDEVSYILEHGPDLVSGAITINENNSTNHISSSL